jgi:NAD(P)-dependent dehydrogenase (short-subunit alcohol dehydrogenase family)
MNTNTYQQQAIRLPLQPMLLAANVTAPCLLLGAGANLPPTAAAVARLPCCYPPAQLLINNAGVYGKRGGFADFRQQDFLEVYATNAVGPYLVAQQLHQQVRSTGRGDEMKGWQGPSECGTRWHSSCTSR